ncbi:MAG: hypothetical protein ACOYIP_00485 [Coriobacteriales bacterium]|jgi:hypothetical protein
MKCPHCGAEQSSHLKMCSQCGSPLLAGSPDETLLVPEDVSQDALLSAIAARLDGRDGDITLVAPDADATVAWSEGRPGDPLDPTLSDMNIPYSAEHAVDSGRDAAIASLDDPTAGEDQSKFAAKYSRYGHGKEGEPIPGSTIDSSEPTVAEVAAAAAVAAVKGRSRRRSIGIMLVVIILLAGIVAGGVAYYMLNQRQAAETTGGTPIVFRLNIPDYREGAASPVPVRVEGKTTEGSAVSDIFCITPSDNTVELQPGTYTVTAAGSPVTADGTIYQYPTIPNKVTVTATTVRVDEVATDGISYAYTAILPEYVTDEQIQAIVAWMSQAGISDDVAIPYRDAIIASRQARLEKLAADAAAREQAAEEQGQQGSEYVPQFDDQGQADAASGYYIENDFAYLAIPDSWATSVEFNTESTGGEELLRIYLYGNPQLPIMYVRKVVEGEESSATFDDDSVDADMVEVWRTERDGAVYTVEACEWPYQFSQNPGYLGLSEDQRNQLVSVSTGGSLTYADAASADAHAVESFLEANVIPTLVVR